MLELSPTGLVGQQPVEEPTHDGSDDKAGGTGHGQPDDGQGRSEGGGHGQSPLVVVVTELDHMEWIVGQPAHWADRRTVR